MKNHPIFCRYQLQNGIEPIPKQTIPRCFGWNKYGKRHKSKIQQLLAKNNKNTHIFPRQPNKKKSVDLFVTTGRPHIFPIFSICFLHFSSFFPIFPPAIFGKKSPHPDLPTDRGLKLSGWRWLPSYAFLGLSTPSGWEFFGNLRVSTLAEHHSTPGNKALLETRWWQLKYFRNFHPENWGFMIHFDGSHIFKMGGEKPPTSWDFFFGNFCVQRVGKKRR